MFKSFSFIVKATVGMVTNFRITGTCRVKCYSLPFKKDGDISHGTFKLPSVLLFEVIL